MDVRVRGVEDLECIFALAARQVAQGMGGADFVHLGGLRMELSFSMFKIVRNWVQPRRACSNCRFCARDMRALGVEEDENSVEVRSWSR